MLKFHKGSSMLMSVRKGKVVNMTYKKKVLITVETLVVVAGAAGLVVNHARNITRGSTEKFTMVQTSPIDSLDPILGYNPSSGTVVGNTYEGLYSVDDKNKVHLALAAKVKTSEDGKTKTFTIRKNAKWSNGTPVTADDFVFAWRRLANPKNASGFNFQPGAAGLKNADDIVAGKKPVSSLGVSAEGKKTLVLHLDRKVPYLNKLLSFNAFAPVNEQFYKKAGKNFAQNDQNLISAGPYKVKDWELGDNEVTLVKNKDYWDAKHVQAKTVKMNIITDPEKAAIAFKDGSADYTPISGQLATKFREDKAFKTELGPFTQYLMINMKKKGLDNADLRKVINSSINKKTITNHILKDGSEPVKSMIMKDLYKDTTNNDKDFADESAAGYTYSPAKAKAYWQAAKSETNLRAFTITYDDSDPSYANVAAYMKSQIEKNLPGMKVTLQQLSKKTRIDKMGSGDFETVLTRWGPDYADPSAILSMYQSDNVSNYAKFNSPEYDQLLADAASKYADDTAKRNDTLQKANNLLIDSAASAPLYQSGAPVLQRQNIHGLVQHISGVPYTFKYVTLKR
ncbi:oligopeptide transport system substrate-binding protein [Weissella hellenica]|uniref:Oligopeptide transport system substrate-binding protein n=2 Tax=Weissella hellenica TaxID=46256 RepID=A0ABY0JYT3_WEIHE|nr:oligopeptide transport system substrate-binding protein [Weissella hellenica]